MPFCCFEAHLIKARMPAGGSFYWGNWRELLKLGCNGVFLWLCFCVFAFVCLCTFILVYLCLGVCAPAYWCICVSVQFLLRKLAEAPKVQLQCCSRFTLFYKSCNHVVYYVEWNIYIGHARIYWLWDKNTFTSTFLKSGPYHLKLIVYSYCNSDWSFVKWKFDKCAAVCWDSITYYSLKSSLRR